MIAPPLNDATCLGQITDVVREYVQARDAALVDLAQHCRSRDAVIAYLRNLPQRDDENDPNDGPRATACQPSQRIRLSPIPADPNCVERAAIYLAVMEFLDARPVRQLKTSETPWGLHTYPVEDCWPVVLNPRVSRNALVADLFQALPLAYPVSLRDGIEWLLAIAEEPAAAVAGGLERIRDAREALAALLDGYSLDDCSIDAIAYACALAGREARYFGGAGRSLIREIIRALGVRMGRVAEPVVGPAVATFAEPSPDQRNLSLDIAGFKIEPDWNVLNAIGRVGLRLGADVGTAVVQGKLASLGLTPPVMSVLEHEFNKEGVTLGPLAPKAPSLAALALLPLVPGLGGIAPIAGALAASSMLAPSSAPSTTPNTTHTTTTAAAQRTANLAAASIGGTAMVASLRNAQPQLRNKLIPIVTPGEILDEMRITDQDLKALSSDIYQTFRAPFDAQKEAAEKRFAQEYGRVPGAGIASTGPGDPGTGLSPQTVCAPTKMPKGPDAITCKHIPIKLTAQNAFLSSEADYDKVYSYMKPVPTAADRSAMAYQGEFVRNWDRFQDEWDTFFAGHQGWFDRFWGGVYDETLDYRDRVKTWRQKFVDLGGTPSSPAPLDPKDRSPLPDFWHDLTTIAIVGGVALGGITVISLLRK